MNKVLRATLVSAVAITATIGIASFVLSFAALWDLATMAGVPRVLSWLWPVIVDGTILQATISVIALAQFDDQRRGRRFFWGVLVAAALVSISTNALHAFISDAGTLHPALSAAVATVAPVSLLAATHGLGILVRVPVGESNASENYPSTDPVEREEVVPQASVEGRTLDNLVAPRLPEPDSEPDRVEAAAFDRRAAPRFPVVQDHAAEPRRIEPVDNEPLDEVDRWILDEDRVEDLYPVDAP